MAITQVWETLKDAIFSYTGLSSTGVFTLLAVAAAVYYVISGIYYPPPSQDSKRFVDSEPLPAPVHLGEITADKLKMYDGSDPKKPLLMAVKGQIYDVSQSRLFYGPGSPYALFAGKDASRALAKMSLDEKDLTDDVSGLGSFEIDSLQDWECKFMNKYVKVGSIKQKLPPSKDIESTNTTKHGSSANANNQESPTRETSSSSPMEIDGQTNKLISSAKETDEQTNGVISSTRAVDEHTKEVISTDKDVDDSTKTTKHGSFANANNQESPAREASYSPMDIDNHTSEDIFSAKETDNGQTNKLIFSAKETDGGQTNKLISSAQETDGHTNEVISSARAVDEHTEEVISTDKDVDVEHIKEENAKEVVGILAKESGDEQTKESETDKE